MVAHGWEQAPRNPWHKYVFRLSSVTAASLGGEILNGTPDTTAFQDVDCRCCMVIYHHSLFETLSLD